MSIYKQIADKYFDDAVKTIIELVNVNSVYDESSVTNDNPYGKGVANALEKFKNIAQSLGFSAEIIGNRVVEIKVGNTGKEVGIFGHLDVVPATGDWISDPFKAEIRENRIYGRGTSDDKGPIVCALFAILGLAENNLIDGYKIRLVAGGDEERGSSCLEHYFEVLKYPAVDCGFTPDADFPLIYGEKGIVNYTLNKSFLIDDLIEIDAGVASNSVIDKAKVLVKNKENLISYLESLEEKVEYIVDGDYIIFVGRSAHGALPELGKNSGIAMISVLGDYYNNEFLKDLAYKYKDYNGKNLNLCFESKNMGITTYNVGLISYKDNLFSMTVNFRFPETVVIEDVIEKIKNSSNCEVILDRISPVLYFDPNSKMIQTLFKAYVEESKDTKTPMMTIGGGTYAKEAKNIVAFGSKFPGKEDHIHEPNEKIDLEDVLNSIQLYARAIHDLGKM